MDNTPEINPIHEKLKIPQDWKFPERDNPRLKVLQIDPDQRFLAFALPYEHSFLPPPPPSPHSGVNGREREYIFSTKGSALQDRFQDDYIRADGGLTAIKGIFGEGRLTYAFFRDKVLSKTSDWSEFDLWFRTVEEGESRYDIGYLRYSGLGILERLSLGELFEERRGQEEQIESPEVGLDLKLDRTNAFLSPSLEQHIWFRRYNRYRRIYDRSSEYIRESSEFIIPDEKSSKPLFKVEWEVANGAFVLKQTHLPSQIEKILEAPMRLDTINVAQAAFSRPPYPKDENGRLVIPWTNIGRIVGASLGYSFPPPTHKIT